MIKLLKMSLLKKNVLLYLLLVGLPISLFSFTYLHYKTNSAYSALVEEANKNASLHALYIENFIGETVGRLESLAMILSDQQNNNIFIEDLLKNIHGQDPRFSGFYWVDRDGDILESSNPLLGKLNIADRLYFQDAVHTGRTQISNPHIGMVTGRYIFSIATPVINKDDQIQGVLVGSVQLNMMEEYVQELVLDEVIQVLDDNGQILLQTRGLLDHRQWASSFIKLKAVPWKVNAMLKLDYNQSVLRPFLIYLAIALVLTNIMFILIQSLLSRREIARELSQNEADKLKLISTIAAGTAHEIRNPLTGIKGFISLLSEKYKDSKDQYYFSLIQTEVDRINAIVSELLIIGKPAVASSEIVAINNVLKEMIPLIESEARMYNVELSVRLTMEPDYVNISRDHLKQIVLNLVKNALEAMETGGRLSIVSERAENHALIKIIDTGQGMSPEVVKGLFIPFFTKKENGTGLGLVVSKRILDSYRGELLVDSEEGIGTQMTIRIPLVQQPRTLSI
ncbi:ATP-binding protein [Paenibacillus sp. sgz302251]|uniref:ATP-binding protein n=1 Tax=Paenibacillus sp. sgz302251 TaxID=3414493 RepID=UPI003C7C4B3F